MRRAFCHLYVGDLCHRGIRVHYPGECLAPASSVTASALLDPLCVLLVIPDVGVGS